jgi:uncharacterized membrane protein
MGQTLMRVVLWFLVALLVVVALQMVFGSVSLAGVAIGLVLLIAAVVAAVRLRRGRPATS